jgi:rod shape-determining protein MreC
LGAFPRAGASGSSSNDNRVLVRRLVAAGLVVASLVLLTVYLRESDDGALHAAQRIGQAALNPFEVAGERIARPFQDAYDWGSELANAKEERDRLEAEVQSLQQEVVGLQTAAQENTRLRDLLAYVDGARLPEGYKPIVTRVLAQPSSAYDQEILVAAGADDGVRKDSPVVTQDGLVGIVTAVSPDAARVTLLTDQSIAVSAYDVTTNAAGVVQPASSAGSGLVLDRVPKELVVTEGDVIATAGWRSGELESLYPREIPIGRVTSVGLQDIDLFQRIQVTPFVNFDALSDVIVLVPR